ncbi:uncharacterized protein LOC102677193 [Apis dorsata]|uniref:uncharacterized protein LOC102677193 n=1 Tax=Apis dorsata TaxID=7462 RepID=UPI0003DF5B36|nr:uncharacterized protein LOC102677193 [Apis dorsata]
MRGPTGPTINSTLSSLNNVVSSTLSKSIFHRYISCLIFRDAIESSIRDLLALVTSKRGRRQQRIKNTGRTNIEAGESGTKIKKEKATARGKGREKRKTENSNAECPDNAPVELGPTNGPHHHHWDHRLRWSSSFSFFSSIRLSFIRFSFLFCLFDVSTICILKSAILFIAL